MYVQISAERVTVRDSKTGVTISEVPEIAIARGAKPKVIAAGTAARELQSDSVSVVNPFDHPRTLVSDFSGAEQLLRAFLVKVRPRPFFSWPRLVLHLQGNPAGGFTELEARAFREMGRATGAREVVVWQGPNLTDEELHSRQFPGDGKILA